MLKRAILCETNVRRKCFRVLRAYISYSSNEYSKKFKLHLCFFSFICAYVHFTLFTVDDDHLQQVFKKI